MTESITTPNALVQTQSGKRFYINSGLVSVDNTETAVVDIANIGERDIRLNINPILTTESGDNMTMKIKNNGLIIYQSIHDVQNTLSLGALRKFIIPANTSLIITFTNVGGTSHDVGVSCYGKFV